MKTMEIIRKWSRRKSRFSFTGFAWLLFRQNQMACYNVKGGGGGKWKENEKKERKRREKATEINKQMFIEMNYINFPMISSFSLRKRCYLKRWNYRTQAVFPSWGINMKGLSLLSSYGAIRTIFLCFSCGGGECDESLGSQQFSGILVGHYIVKF